MVFLLIGAGAVGQQGAVVLLAKGKATGAGEG